MLAMAEELANENLLWDDESWPFPNLCADEDDSGKTTPDGKDEEAAPPAGKGKKRSAAEEGGGDGGGGGESDDHELHIWTERERRKKMRNMFSSLHALLPHIPPKADKSTIVDEAVKHIKKLQHTLQELQKRKLERLHGIILHNPIQKLAIQTREAFLAEQGPTNLGPTLTSPSPGPLFMGPPIFKTWTSPNVILNVCGKEAHISVCSVRKPGLLTAICFVMEKYNFDVVSAQISSDRARSMYMIHARANGGAEQFQQAIFPIEEIFKQAAAEIMLWVNS